MKKILVFLLFLLAACSIRSDPQLPAPAVSPVNQATQTSSLPFTETPLPVTEPDLKVTPSLTPTEPPTPTPTPTATVTRPAPTIPPNFATLKIAFVSMKEKRLSVWFQGETKAIADLEEETTLFRISSDGEIVVYRVSSGLWAVNSDGTGKRLLVANDGLPANPEAQGKKSMIDAFEWIPNTHRLIFNTHVDTEGECCYWYNHDLYMVDADTLKMKNLFPMGKSGLISSFSPDGKYLVLRYQNSIHLLNLTTYEKFNLKNYEPIMVPSEEGGSLTPQWSKDSKYLMLVVPPPDILYGTNLPTKIWKLPVNRQSPQLVSTFGSEFGFVRLSPDFLSVTGERVIAEKGNDREVEIHVLNLDGSEDEIYQTGRLAFRGWTPDSSHFMFSKGDVNYLGQQGARPVEFPFPVDQGFLDWLDGETFLYPAYHDKSEIRLGFLDGSSFPLVQAASIDRFHFAWKADSK